LKQGNRKSRVFISSGGTEPVLDRGCQNGNHSIFACAFLSGLRQGDRPEFASGVFSSGELYHMALLPQVGGKVQQQPERREIRDSGHEGGDFVFARVDVQEKGRQVEAGTKTK
jgi:hypothetical protein